VQYEPLAQSPPRQSFEQQSAPVVHALPLVRQAGLSGAQVPSPPRQLPLQHCAELVQAWLSEVHWVPPQTPLAQTNVQQSCGIVHELPPGLHCPPLVLQTFITVSQLSEQQSALLLHVSPT
jgi:hypothetical protein